MKHSYEELEMEVITFDTKDVIIESGSDENEGPIIGGDDV